MTARGYTVSPAALQEARAEALLARQELRNAYHLVRGHQSLAVQAEVAGKAVAHLLTMIEARQTGTAT